MRSKQSRLFARLNGGPDGAVLRAETLWKERTFRILSFIGFFGTLAVYSPNIMVLQSVDKGGLTGFFAEPCLTCAFLSALAIAIGSFSGRSFLASLQNRIDPRCVLGVYAVGVCGFAVTIRAQPACGTCLSAVCAVLVGCSVIPSCVIWSNAFEGEDLSTAVRAVAIAGGASAVINHTISQLSVTPTVLMYLALVIVGIAYPFAHNRTKRRERIPIECQEEAARGHIDIRAFCSVMSMPLIGMAISSFAMGVQPVFLFDGSVDAQRIGMVVGAMPLLCASRFTLQPMYSFIYRAVIPVIAAGVLALCMAPLGAVLFDVALVAVYGLYSMISGFAIAAAMAIANAHEFPRPFVCATLFGVFCATGLFGLFTGAHNIFLFDNNAAVLAMLTAVYGAAIMLSGCIKSWRLTIAPTVDDVVVGAERGRGKLTETASCETFDEKLMRVSTETGLSPRETQIIGYIGRGHSSVYVAKTLLISESTVYSHVRNIYRKLGVTSREELIQLLNGSEGYGSDEV